MCNTNSLPRASPSLSTAASNLSSERIIAQDAAPGPPPPLSSPMSIADASLQSDPTTLAAALSEAVQLLNSSARPLVLGGSYLHLLQWVGVGEQRGATPLNKSNLGIAPLVALLDASGYASALHDTDNRVRALSVHCIRGEVSCEC